MKVTVCDISGMGGREFGGYEWGCQIIAARTARFIRDLKTESELPKFHSYTNITGILVEDNDVAKKLSEYVLAHPKLKEYGVTGAMHQFGVMHGCKLAELGREKYLEELRPHRTDEDFYEFEENDAFPELVATTV